VTGFMAPQKVLETVNQADRHGGHNCASVQSGVKASDGVETDGVKICSGIDHQPLSGFGHWSFVGY
jgi:hypothetical protein